MHPKPKDNPIRTIYDRLLAHYGSQHWWPARTDAEIVIGAILTQNTAWSNVERALARLEQSKCLTLPAIHGLSRPKLEALIRPSGTYRVKAGRLKAFVDVLFREFGGSLPDMLSGDLPAVRARLTAIHGIGPETADAILLYAGRRPVFVVDAYTKRVLRRHHRVDPDADYDTVANVFVEALPTETALFNEYHALLVAVGKEFCRTQARCEGCPLETLPHDANR